MKTYNKPSQLGDEYSKSHQDPRNIACHAIGIPMILISLVVLFFNPLLAAGLFILGWAFQFLGHYFEGKMPAFFKDPRFLIAGPLHLARKLVARLRHS